MVITHHLVGLRSHRFEERLYGNLIALQPERG